MPTNSQPQCTTARLVPQSPAGGLPSRAYFYARKSLVATWQQTGFTLVACSFPRAELETLAHYLRYTESTVGKRLADARRHERARLLEQAIYAGEPMTFAHSSDEAALRRLQAIIRAPELVLPRIRIYVASALRRLYNQRNMIMHSGRFQSCALSVAIRTTPPLVGAGIDRIAFGVRNGVRPLELVARADVEMGLLGKPGRGR